MYFFAKSMPETSGMSPSAVKTLVLVAQKQGPKWVSYVQVALLMFLVFKLGPYVKDVVFADRAPFLLELLVVLVLSIAIMSVLWVIQLNVFIRPEIQRIRGPEPNKSMSQT